ncbi:Ger(x)C family germination protein [Paenibacillus cellulosilyticus]|uniref:Ger(X)C family germination protein n=1 Tax=Paenibacillus cellulosilyticus TaxID=375489 RepID=A0A2V2YSX7_9BACL|nr:Ger(x)C family spore germination protein [Paenibacillus cellulosilyticus]PWW01259.1 Ger(x)C family germination protein [Paenibacillus cellulosilyticus]QKS46794.1 Ger(x)C family spore germination protein [Paenibacillus cellulosilyticus]
MIGHTLRIIGSITLCLVLAGCWSSSEIQSVMYVKAIGLDYKGGNFHIYVQTFDFSSVAKTDSSGKANESPGIWVGHGKGKTMNLAINNLYQTAQMHMAWGHVTAMVLSESLLNSNYVEGVLDMINRYPEARYTTWVFGTRMPIDKLFTVTSIFNMSPLESILHNPLPSFREDSLLRPLQTMTFMADLHARSSRAYLPSISYNDKSWNQNENSHDLLFLEGVFFERNDSTPGYVNKNRLFGFSLMDSNMRKAPLMIEQNGVPIGVISIGLPKIKIKPIVRGNEVHFKIKASYYGSLYEYLEPMSYEEMAKLTADTAKKYIMNTYIEALKKNIDVYNLENRLYRKHPKLWRKLSNNGSVLILNENSIESLDVKVRIIYNGKYKRVPGEKSKGTHSSTNRYSIQMN